MEILLHIHSVLRWVILLLAIIVLVNSYTGFSQKKLFKKSDDQLSLFLFIACHLMLLIGIYQYFLGANGMHLFSNNDIGFVMKDKMSRFFAIEHPLMMTIGIIFISIGRFTSKKAITDYSKFKKLFTYSLIGFILILSRIPFPFMQGFSDRGWF